MPRQKRFLRVGFRKRSSSEKEWRQVEATEQAFSYLSSSDLGISPYTPARVLGP